MKNTEQQVLEVEVEVMTEALEAQEQQVLYDIKYNISQAVEDQNCGFITYKEMIELIEEQISKLKINIIN